jgi:hypothetical protein
MKAFNALFYLLLLAGFTQPSFLWAAQSYRVNNGTNTDINEHSVCQKVTNSCGSDIFVPTNTSTEWSNFRSSKPACATLSACAPTGGLWGYPIVENCMDMFGTACIPQNNCGYTFPQGMPCSPVGSMCVKATNLTWSEHWCE